MAALDALYDNPAAMPDPSGDGYEGEDHPDQHVFTLDELQARILVTNLADDPDRPMSDEELTKIGSRVVRETKIDDDSRESWRKRTEAGFSLAMQENKAKTFPWANAANIQFPLMTTAAIQFAARAYPAIVAGNDVVKAQITGADPQGLKRARADRVAAHMSWQCLTEMPEWEPGVDRMLHALPIMGCVFKKTYFDPTLGRNRSDYVSAFDFIVNSSALSIEVAPRCTHRITLYPYQIEERFRSGVFRKFKYGSPSPSDTEKKQGQAPVDPNDDDAPHEFYEQHRRLDLDDDGYSEPYIVTVHKDTEEVCRIVAGYGEDGIIVDKSNGKIVAIEPRKFFTKIPFIPNPEGGFYDVGFAWLLSPLNRAIDTIINQLLDAGTLANTGGGFIGSQLRLKGGTMRFSPGEYKEVDVPGGIVKDNIVSLTFPGPSEVLFKLLGMLIESGREVASVKDVLTGDAPGGGANTPATTTLALIEQGLKVFTAIYKRIHRGMKEEFGKLYKLNRQYFDPTMYAAFTDIPEISADDYKGDPIDIIPVSDPSMVSDMQKLARAEFLERFKESPGMNPMAINQRQLEAAGIPNIEELFAKQQGPTPEALAHYAELEATIANMNAKTQQMEAQAVLLLAQAEQLEPAAQLEAIKVWISSFTAHNDAAQGATQPGGEGKPPTKMPIKPPLLNAPMPGAPTPGVSAPMAANAGVAPQ